MSATAQETENIIENAIKRYVNKYGNKPTIEQDLLSIADVVKKVSLSQTTIWRDMKKNKFPKPRRKRKPQAWHIDDINEYTKDPDNWQDKN